MDAPVAVTSWSAHLPGLPPGTEFAGWAPGPACGPEEAGRLLGRKGLRYRKPATILALCAVHRALGHEPGARVRAAMEPRTAVVASSNLGNVQTVGAVARAIRDEGGRGASPLDAPDVSSNVLASSVAIWFGFGGPNLMVCSGHPAGLDAVLLAQVLLAADRADRVVVVGAEPADPFATGILGGEPALRAASACLVLTRGAGGPAPLLERVRCLPLATPGIAAQGEAPIDVTARIGQTYGALGVLQVAIAAALVDRGAGPVRVVCGDPGDGYRWTSVSRGA